MSEFNGAELRLARIFHGLALEELGNRVGKTRQYIHKLETGQDVPTSSLLQQLAAALQVETEFLCQRPKVQTFEEQFHFRKLFTTKAMQKQVVMAHGELLQRLLGYLDQTLKLPPVRIPQINIDPHNVEEIELAAERCRREWGLGLGPIMHMSRLAENLGIIVAQFAADSSEIDALSLTGQRPLILRSNFKESPGRMRFDIAHELGHFVMHTGITTGDRTTESQANRFASALLLPRAMMAQHFPRPHGSRLDWQGMRQFKLQWKVNKAAILYRARQLELISEAQYKSGVITLKRTGEANGEKEDRLGLLPVESPELLQKALTILAERKGIYAPQLAQELHITPELLEHLCGLSLPTGNKPASHLRLVK